MRTTSKILIILLAIVAVARFASADIKLQNDIRLPVESQAVKLLIDDATTTKMSFVSPEFTPHRSIDGLDHNSRVVSEDQIATTQEGYPELPVYSNVVIVPPTSDIALQINNLDVQTISDFNPFIVPFAESEEELNTSGIPSEDFLTHDGFWPPNPVVVSEPVILRGYRLVTVTVYPMQYNPQTKELRLNENIDFQLIYDGIGENIVSNPNKRKASSSIQNILEHLVINPPRRDNPNFQNERGSYLLIYPNVNGVRDALEPLLTWRARQGWDVRVIEVQNNAQTNTVKRHIQDAYDDWDNPPEMVVVVGDADGSIAISAWNQTDLDYVLLEGNDIIADADFGRLSVNSVAQLNTVVSKLVSYEADPWMQDVDWYNQGMVIAGSSNSGTSTILLNRWLRREWMAMGVEDVHEWYYTAPFDNMSVPGYFSNEFGRGVIFSNYRGWIGIEGLTPDAIMNFGQHRRYPVCVILTCASGNFIGQTGHTEAMLRSPGGSIGAVGLYTSQTKVQFNNAVSSGIWYGILKAGTFNFGTAVNYGRYELWKQYSGFDNANVETFSRWTNFKGDPATHVWTGVPREIYANCNENFPLGVNGIHVDVYFEDNERAVEGALVTLYKPDDEFQLSLLTDRHGIADFAFDSYALTEGEMMVTVTKHNHTPVLQTVNIVEEQLYYGAETWHIIDDNQAGRRGDNDGLANPSEFIDLVVNIKNFGTENLDIRTSAVFISRSINVEIANNEVLIEELPRVGETIEVPVRLIISPLAQDEEIALIEVNVNHGEAAFISLVAFEIYAPTLEVINVILPDNILRRGETKSMDLLIENTGRKAVAPFSLELSLDDRNIKMIEHEANFPEIQPLQSARITGAKFEISAHPFSIPGSSVEIIGEAFAENGIMPQFKPFSVQLAQPARTDPFGPDKYGYVCFDSGDEDWENRPVYDWIEIDPTVQGFQFRGTDTQLRDNGEDYDQSMMVELPFEFQYYGEVFNQLTICTNGWVAFGNYRELAQFRNRRIASADVPRAMVAPFWDNLMTGKVLYHYDEEHGRFIVQWSGMTRQNGGGGTMNFQLILNDTRLYPTYSGDGEIIFQYRTIQNAGQQGGDPRNDTPFATVGIGNLDQTDGLEYTYWNIYHQGATPLANNLAIKFTTAVTFITGVIKGKVVDAETNEPIANAQVTTTKGFWARTNDAGEFFNDEILIGQGYYITARAHGYNDSTIYGVDGNGFTVVEDDTIVVNFALLHPQFALSRETLRYQMNADEEYNETITLTNEGNGPLWFSSRFTQPNFGEAPGRDEVYDMLHSWNAFDSTGDSKLYGIAWMKDRWVITGGANGNLELNYFHFFDKLGNYLGNVEQPIDISRYGLRGIKYYGGYLYAAYLDSSRILRIDTENWEIVNSWRIPGRLRSPYNVTLDDDGFIYAAGISNPIYKYEVVDDTTLVEVDVFDKVDPRALGIQIRIYGLDWFRDDPDGYNLYMYSSNAPIENPNERLADVSIFKMNVNTREIKFLSNLPAIERGNIANGSMTITPNWDNRYYAMACNISLSSRNWVGVFELGPNTSWIDYSPRSDTLQTGERLPIEMMISTSELDTGEYSVYIEFTHNSNGLVTYVPVELIITTSSISTDDVLPLDYSLEQNFPNPFNPKTSISYSLRTADITTVSIFDLQGRKVADLVNSYQDAGSYRIAFDGSALASGIYLYQIKSGNFTSVKKMALLK